ncbi:MAG: M6 family metalloprotease domain-containing protein, partial [Muribaculaceae bacterium]|nr:M6 family metalloprotease domain-containing protein [Muribaculaceae bacterium]
CDLLGTASALAVPAKPTPIKFTQPDGSTVTVQLRGDERHHWYQTLDGYLLVNKENTLYYGIAGPSGEIKSTGYRATEIDRRSAKVKELLAGVDMEATLETLNKERARSPRLRSEAALLEKSQARNQAKAAGAAPTVDDIYGKGLFSGEHYPVFGEQKGLVILVEYTDVKFQDPASVYGGDVNAYYTDMLNGDNFNRHNGTGSARQWFIDNSDGQFLPTFDVYGPVTLSSRMSYYGGNDFYGDDAHPELMAVEACQQLDDTVDFSQYDRDGDGYIDNVYVIYAGRGEASGGSADSVWPHSWNVSSAGIGSYMFDDKYLDRYACSNEWDGEAPDGIGTFVHEFSHVLGLPDIYPTSYTEAFTPGDWCVMDYGNYNNDSRTPPNYGIFERNALGWLKPKQLTGDVVADFTVKPIADMDGYVILTNRSDEFFLIENRQQTGWDKYIPGHGMLVWHIDYNSSVWSSNTVNNDKNHQYVDIVEADDIRSKESRAGDAFPGTRNVTEFTHRTVPSMKTWAGVELKVPLRNIREVDGDIIFNGGYIPVPAPGKITAYEVADSDISTTSFTARWSADANSTYYLVNIYNEEHRVVWNRKNVGDATEATIAGLKPDNLYYFTVTPCNEDADGDPSNEVAVRTLPPTLDFLKTNALDATEVGATYFTANWEHFDIATDYILNVYKQEATPLIEVMTDFSDGLPSGWKSNATSTVGDLSFDKKGYLLTSTYPECIKKVFFNLAITDPEAGSVLRVMGMSPDSFAWKEIEILSLDEFVGNQFSSVSVPEDINGLYLEFVPVGDCKITIDDLRIVYGGTVTASSAHETYTNYSTGPVSSIQLTGLDPDTQYEYNVQAVNDTHHARVSDTIVVRTKELSGVEEVVTDTADSSAEYFNLQGICIAAPAAGSIYIERRGADTRKVLIK